MKETKKPNVAIIKTGGINCDEELYHAFSEAFDRAGAASSYVHISDLIAGNENLSNYQIMALPGGFSYGDDIASGRILANKFLLPLADQTNDYVAKNQGLVIGICNGFQVLVRSGLLPFKEPIQTLADMEATLVHNDSGNFECRWVDLKIEQNNRCVFMQDMQESVSYQVAHGEGKFHTSDDTLQVLEAEDLVVFRYVDSRGEPTQEYPYNPNGSINAIAGITDPSGRILGMMPHPERYVRREQHPNWRRESDRQPEGLPIFEKMVNYAREM